MMLTASADRLRDFNRASGGAIDPALLEIGARCKSPCSIDECSDAITASRRIRELGNDAVAYLDVLAARYFESNVGVLCAAFSRRIERASACRIERDANDSLRRSL